jgi:hypothetical protein
MLKSALIHIAISVNHCDDGISEPADVLGGDGKQLIPKASRFPRSVRKSTYSFPRAQEEFDRIIRKSWLNKTLAENGQSAFLFADSVIAKSA